MKNIISIIILLLFTTCGTKETNTPKQEIIENELDIIDLTEAQSESIQIEFGTLESKNISHPGSSTKFNFCWYAIGWIFESLKINARNAGLQR